MTELLDFMRTNALPISLLLLVVQVLLLMVAQHYRIQMRKVRLEVLANIEALRMMGAQLQGWTDAMRAERRAWAEARAQALAAGLIDENGDRVAGVAEATAHPSPFASGDGAGVSSPGASSVPAPNVPVGKGAGAHPVGGAVPKKS